jgi:hypothetical protein
MIENKTPAEVAAALREYADSEAEDRTGSPWLLREAAGFLDRLDAAMKVSHAARKLQAGMNDSVDSQPRVKATEVRAVREALRALDRGDGIRR